MQFLSGLHFFSFLSKGPLGFTISVGRLLFDFIFLGHLLIDRYCLLVISFYLLVGNLRSVSVMRFGFVLLPLLPLLMELN